jgi:hypothetical protein
MGNLSRSLELSRNVITDYDYWFNNQLFTPDRDMLYAFMDAHAYIFNCVSTKYPKPNTDGVGHAELSEYVRNAVALITRTYYKLAAFKTLVTRYAEIHIVPYMFNLDSDDQFWMAFDGYVLDGRDAL